MSPRVVLVACIGLVVLGFVLPLWPLVVLGIVLAALVGRWFAAFIMGLIVDVAWGMPLGLMHGVHYPFTLLALLAALVRFVASRYVIDRNLPERL